MNRFLTREETKAYTEHYLKYKDAESGQILWDSIVPFFAKELHSFFEQKKIPNFFEENKDDLLSACRVEFFSRIAGYKSEFAITTFFNRNVVKGIAWSVFANELTQGMLKKNSMINCATVKHVHDILPQGENSPADISRHIERTSGKKISPKCVEKYLYMAEETCVLVSDTQDYIDISRHAYRYRLPSPENIVLEKERQENLQAVIKDCADKFRSETEKDMLYFLLHFAYECPNEKITPKNVYNKWREEDREEMDSESFKNLFFRTLYGAKKNINRKVAFA